MSRNAGLAILESTLTVRRTLQISSRGRRKRSRGQSVKKGVELKTNIDVSLAVEIAVKGQDEKSLRYVSLANKHKSFMDEGTAKTKECVWKRQSVRSCKGRQKKGHASGGNHIGVGTGQPNKVYGQAQFTEGWTCKKYQSHYFGKRKGLKNRTTSG